MPWFRDKYADAVRDCGYALRPNEKLVALVYAEHAGDPANPANDVSWVSWPRLSEQTGIRSKDALNRAVRHLEKRGWLVLAEARRQHKSPRYRLVIPDRPEVRDTYVWDGSVVRETDPCPDQVQAAEVREPNVSAIPEVRLADISPPPEVRETTPEVRETTPRGTRNGPDPSTYPSTTDNPRSLDSNHRPPARPSCLHRWTRDGDCVRCHRHEPCPACRQLSHINDTIRCHQHQPPEPPVTTTLCNWQRPDGFPTDDYFAAVMSTIDKAGIGVVIDSREEDWEYNFEIAPDSYRGGPLAWAAKGLWISWRCDELDQPSHPDDFTGPGWYWVPYTKSGASGDFAKEFALPYLAEPAEVAEAIRDLIQPRDDQRAPA